MAPRGAQFRGEGSARLRWCLLLRLAAGHSRWACPEPRSPNTGIKDAMCGAQTNDFSDRLLDGDGSPVVISPGLLTVTFEESITHRGGGWWIRLSADGTDDETQSCMLLDHIPHDEESFPIYGFDFTYHKLSVTVRIPDVSCESCSLQLGNPMTDKIGADGEPSGAGCTDPFGSCFSVYYSCSKVFRISGSQPRSEYTCPGQPADWPRQWLSPRSGAIESWPVVGAGEAGVYRRESALWSGDGAARFIADLPGVYTVPEAYRTAAGGLCMGPSAANISSSATSTSTTSPAGATIATTTNADMTSAATGTTRTTTTTTPARTSSSNSADNPSDTTRPDIVLDRDPTGSDQVYAGAMSASTRSGVTTFTTTGASNSQLPDFEESSATEATKPAENEELQEMEPLINAASRSVLAFAYMVAFPAAHTLGA